MSIRVIVQVWIACFYCGLIHESKTDKPIGWLVFIAGKSGGIIPFESVHALTGTDPSPECVASLIRLAATRGLQDPSVLREALDFEKALACDEIQIH